MNRLLSSILLYLIFILCSFAAPVDSNFAVDHLQSGNGKTKVAFDSTGRMYVTEKQGRLLLFEPDGNGGFQPPAVLLDITSNVDSALEAGLLGLEVDPDHANNRFIYLFYTTATDQRLVRYTMNGTFNGITAGSETVLLSGLPRNVTFHKAGDIGIHPLDPFAIFISLGDDDQIYPDNMLPQNIDSYVGKILRVDTSTGLGLADNPHYNSVPNSVRSRVWASGLRNPFRFAFHPTRADTLYVSENGDSTDRVSVVRAGGNGLWNGNDNGGFLTVNTPLFKVLHTESASLVGIEIAPSGPFAHNANPTLYVANWLSGISRYTLSDSTNPQGTNWDTLTAIPSGGGASHWDSDATAMDLHLAADGHLYYAQTQGDASLAGWFPLRRYRFAVGNPPVASFTTNPATGTGETPFIVSFTDTSTQGTNNLTAWHWDFGDGNSSTLQNPSHTYSSPGAYTVTLTVTDSVGLTDDAQQPLAATTSTPVSLMLEIHDGRTLPPVPVTSTFTISFFQADGTTPLSFSGGSGANGNQLTTMADGTYTGSVSLPLTSAGFVMKTDNATPPVFQSVTRGVTVALGSINVVHEEFYVSTTSVSGQVLSHRGAPAVVDVGVSSAGSPFPFAGARDYLLSSKIPATGILHRVTSDDLGYFSIPIPTTGVGATLELTFAEDTGRDRYATRTMSVVTQAGADIDASVVLSEWGGGAQAGDDLSAQPYTPAVNYAVIQNIFSANCTGCHRANTTNNGGLDLTPGNSYGELVNQPSIFAVGVKLVEPGSTSRSYLFEKINSPNPQHGARMRPTDALSLADQALIRDWITQLAPSYENYVRSTLGIVPGSTNSGVDEDFDGDGVSNGLEYSGLSLGTLSSSPNGAIFQGELFVGANVSGLSLCVQASEDLAAGNWKTVASRLRGESLWRVSSGTSISETAPGEFLFSDSTVGFKSRFYRLKVDDQ